MFILPLIVILALPTALPDAPKPISAHKLMRQQYAPTFREVADAKFWTLGVILPMLTTAFEVEGFMHCKSVDRNCHEANAIVGETRPRQYGLKVSLNLAVIWALYYDKQDEMARDRCIGDGSDYCKKLPVLNHLHWWQLALVKPALDTAFGIKNWRTK